MKLSELIPLIEKCIEEHGDLSVAVVREGVRFPAEELLVERTSIYDFAEEGTAVARIF